MAMQHTKIWDQPIDYWEDSPSRRVIDFAFNTAVVRARQRQTIDTHCEQQLRACILPSVFVRMIEHFGVAMNEPRHSTDDCRQWIESEIQQKLSSVLGLQMSDSCHQDG